MIFINKSLFIVILCSIFIPIIAFQDSKMQDVILTSFENGNSKTLSGFFNQNVELVIPQNKNIYSKAQAQQIMAKFFSENTPESFQILSDTIEDDAKNIIGLLTTKKASFRVYIVLKNANGQDFIHLLKIEKRQN